MPSHQRTVIPARAVAAALRSSPSTLPLQTNPTQRAATAALDGARSLRLLRRRANGIRHQHSDRHLPNSPWYGCDERCYLPYLVERYVTDQPSATLFRCVWYLIHADVDHDRARLHHIGCDDLRLTDRRNENVRTSRMIGEVARSA